MSESATTEISVRVNGRFAPGHSGNPGGKYKTGLEALARQHTEAAIAALVRGLKDERHYPVCAQALLDRGWGKPKQTLETTGDNITALHLIAAQALSRELVEELKLGTRTITSEATSVDTADPLSAPPPSE